MLRIPKIRLEVPVLPGTDDRTLDRGVGHIEDTAPPGTAGNSGIAGHRDGFFRGLKDIAAGDVIELDTLQGKQVYRIERTWVVEPEDVSVLDPTPAPALTLVTCYPFYFVGSAPQRFIVRAVRVGDTTVSSLPSAARVPCQRCGNRRLVAMFWSLTSRQCRVSTTEMESPMTRAMVRMVLAAAVVCSTAVGSSAQTDDDLVGNQDLRSALGGRQHPGGQAAGRHQGADVADDFRFTVNDQQLSVHQLKAGMKGTATITTKTTVTPVTVTEVKNGTVRHCDRARPSSSRPTRDTGRSRRAKSTSAA